MSKATFFSLIVSIILTFLATAVMSYVAMATPIGPWIALTLTLIGLIIFKLFRVRDYSHALLTVVFAGSIGGITATAMGFSFPTLYFLDAKTFGSWMSHPWFFMIVAAGLVAAAGWLGLWCANVFQGALVERQQLSFPIGQLVYKMVFAESQEGKTRSLIEGFACTVGYGVLQGGVGVWKGLIPQTITLVKRLSWGVLRLPAVTLDMSILPMLLAIGFVAGHVIAVPLGIGALTKIFLLEPINTILFDHVSSMDFLLAFCSGMVLSGALVGFATTPGQLIRTIKGIINRKNGKSGGSSAFTVSYPLALEGGFVVLVVCFFLHMINFSLVESLYVIVFSVMCTYQIAAIAGKIGLAQLGRFATFVMVPALFLFGYSAVKATVIATFVEICGGVATDALFGRKAAQLAQVSWRTMRWYQYFGLAVSALSIGAIFWVLISHFGLGTSTLFAQRAQARALLINCNSFNVWVVLIGMTFGVLLKKIKLNPMMVLGGLLMPINISIGLIVGGFFALLASDQEQFYPLWSGVFAANSLWMVARAVL